MKKLKKILLIGLTTVILMGCETLGMPTKQTSIDIKQPNMVVFWNGGAVCMDRPDAEEFFKYVYDLERAVGLVK